ncbi:hypothetical protein [Yinghuangia seranimata]|uniref:hypothetical protein n=1 Tax=Yinghuangia seranimata TaxID=408067 RepID=UPI00248AD6B6|nr:hypothetical protein [Yinghuangia seranimata]MDI2129828.1 hypothetical protein [Yinghuangia seranimata]
MIFAPKDDPNALVIGPTAVTFAQRGAPARPGRALVLSLEDGAVVEVPRRPTAMESFRFKYRYEVDIGDHPVSWDEAFPSGTGGFEFLATLEARWRVTGPVDVVRRGMRTLADGHEVVRLRMRDLIWPHTGAYGIDRLADASRMLWVRFCAGPHELPEGITVVSLMVRLFLDPEATEHLRDMRKERWRTDLIGERENALRAAMRGDGGLLLHLIAQDPSQLGQVLNDLATRQDMELAQKQQLLRDLMDHRLIQPAEAQEMWDRMTRPASAFGGMPTTLPGVGDSAPPQIIAGRVVPQRFDEGPPRPRDRGRSDGRGEAEYGPSGPGYGGEPTGRGGPTGPGSPAGPGGAPAGDHTLDLSGRRRPDGPPETMDDAPQTATGVPRSGGLGVDPARSGYGHEPGSGAPDLTGYRAPDGTPDAWAGGGGAPRGGGYGGAYEGGRGGGYGSPFSGGHRSGYDGARGSGYDGQHGGERGSGYGGPHEGGYGVGPDTAPGGGYGDVFGGTHGPGPADGRLPDTVEAYPRDTRPLPDADRPDETGGTNVSGSTPVGRSRRTPPNDGRRDGA